MNWFKFFLTLSLSIFFVLLQSCNNDPCEDITCFYGGTCIDGECDCPHGLAGASCEFLLTPVSMTINKIELKAYPTVNGSSLSSWDSSPISGPDVVLTINSGTIPNPYSFVSGDVFTDADGTILTYTSSFPYTLSSISTVYTIAIWDEDGNSYERMGNIEFIPEQYLNNGFPTTSFDMMEDNVAFRFYVTWNY